MNTHFQKGQKVITPDGEGLIEDILENQVRVRLASGTINSYPAEQLQDDADQG